MHGMSSQRRISIEDGDEALSVTNGGFYWSKEGEELILQDMRRSVAPQAVIDHDMESAGPKELLVHTGVICDVCESTIRGVRQMSGLPWYEPFECPRLPDTHVLQTTTCTPLASRT